MRREGNLLARAAGATVARLVRSPPDRRTIRGIHRLRHTRLGRPTRRGPICDPGRSSTTRPLPRSPPPRTFLSGSGSCRINAWMRNDGTSPHLTEAQRALFPEGTKGLTDVGARLAEMDKLGVDVQILFPSLWLNVGVHDPVIEVALKRSHNRWMADATGPDWGRLRWMINVPTGDIHAACEELEFGAEHGAAGVFLLGEVNAVARRAPLAVPPVPEGRGVGTGHRLPRRGEQHRRAAPLPGWSEGLGDHRPVHVRVRSRSSSTPSGAVSGPQVGLLRSRCRVGALDARQEARLLGPSGSRSERDWRGEADVLKQNNMYVACQTDDDLPYVISRIGSENVVCGSDWGHFDIGSDPAALRMVAGRDDLDQTVRTRIVDTNARILFGIDETFRPTDAVSEVQERGSPATSSPDLTPSANSPGSLPPPRRWPALRRSRP